eukprot:TRINITY_DN7389_c0_g1_i1.p1 TRINITY_DN7389_c0_g1~~TRINITY_DN7389_c0_g1_i1.p1  ORF type:complete len:117 (-),score=26.75 TRINITY_DN7389_c0_g1_i1:96-446(-)
MFVGRQCFELEVNPDFTHFEGVDCTLFKIVNFERFLRLVHRGAVLPLPLATFNDDEMVGEVVDIPGYNDVSLQELYDDETINNETLEGVSDVRVCCRIGSWSNVCTIHFYSSCCYW